MDEAMVVMVSGYKVLSHFIIIRMCQCVININKTMSHATLALRYVTAC